MSTINGYTESERALAALLCDGVNMRWAAPPSTAGQFYNDARRIIELIADTAIPEDWDVSMDWHDAYDTTAAGEDGEDEITHHSALVVITVNGFKFTIAENDPEVQRYDTALDADGEAC